MALEFFRKINKESVFPHPHIYPNDLKLNRKYLIKEVDYFKIKTTKNEDLVRFIIFDQIENKKYAFILPDRLRCLFNERSDIDYFLNTFMFKEGINKCGQSILFFTTNDDELHIENEKLKIDDECEYEETSYY